MKTIEKEIRIDAPPSTVYRFIDRTANAPDWIPSMTAVWNVQGSGPGKTYEWSYRMAGVKLEGKSEVTEARPPTHYQTRSQGGVVSVWDYDIRADGDGARLRLRVQYEIPVPVLGKLGERLLLRRNEREAQLAMENIKELVEHRAAAAKEQPTASAR